MGLLSSPAVYDDKERGWRLSRLSATQLWHIFVQNVDATIKILHIPTDEVTIFTAIHQPESVSSDVLALVNALYFATTLTLEPEEAQHILGIDKPNALRTFKREFQMHLAGADMLENPTVVLLQGLAIYLVRHCLLLNIALITKLLMHESRHHRGLIIMEEASGY